MIAKRKLMKPMLLIAAGVAVFWLILRVFAYGGCEWYGYQTGRDTRFAPFIGCMVKIGDNWVPRNELRVVQ